MNKDKLSIEAKQTTDEERDKQAIKIQATTNKYKDRMTGKRKKSA